LRRKPEKPLSVDIFQILTEMKEKRIENLKSLLRLPFLLEKLWNIR
jgi:hypothetical protein